MMIIIDYSWSLVAMIPIKHPCQISYPICKNRKTQNEDGVRPAHEEGHQTSSAQSEGSLVSTGVPNLDHHNLGPPNLANFGTTLVNTY